VGLNTCQEKKVVMLEDNYLFQEKRQLLHLLKTAIRCQNYFGLTGLYFLVSKWQKNKVSSKSVTPSDDVL